MMIAELLSALQSMGPSCHPICKRAMDAQEDYDDSESAALVAVNLISSARVILKLDNERTEYSAQYLVESACQGQQHSKLTVKDCLEYVFKKGIPKREHWAHLGCVVKAPAFARYIPRVSMKGEVLEADNWKEAYELLLHQPIGAKLHVFSPEIDLVGDGIYKGPSGSGTGYVGLRDVMLVAMKTTERDVIAEVQICYKKKTSFMKVSMNQMFLRAPLDGDQSQVTEPTALLVEFCAPRLSIN